MDSSIIKKININNNLDHYLIWDYAGNLMNTPIISKKKNPIILSVIQEMVKRIHDNEENIFLATGPTVFSSVIFKDITGKEIYSTGDVFKENEKKLLLVKNINYKNGKILYQLSDFCRANICIQFKMEDYDNKYLYPNNDRYIPTFNGEPTPNLYVKQIPYSKRTKLGYSVNNDISKIVAEIQTII